MGHGCSLLFRAIRRLQAQALANLLSDPFRNAENAMARQSREVLAVHRIGIVKSGKQQLEQVLANLRNRSLRGQVRSINMVDPAARRIRAQDRISDMAQLVVHSRPTLWAGSRTVANDSLGAPSCGGYAAEMRL
jgi:hypothetical protein